ncbi:hypothetical protein C922_04483 [Plasmodium inui San Antonio 1]|uniref:Tryptophan/threonine-rich plasmodium antigen C-terminal domain-containing protein n=1 Tax=Plasmodium inui San Antonio 1 TaxID=1237626 RepID=W7A198_9APIC|nr:hypothetical protein C922_04483 [Plasmodium inui San Antonio 1]EUD65083.1 hypothetical protein C922_04483 [Plasmodium inui San Antonio 1]
MEQVAEVADNARTTCSSLLSLPCVKETISGWKHNILNMDKDQMTLTLGIMMVALTSGVVSGVIVKNGDSLDILGEDESNEEETKNKKEFPEKSEEWKQKEWKNWMKKLEQDWEIFNEQLENENNKLIEEKEEEWNTWLKSIEKKWTHFNPNMDKEFHSNMMKRSINWTEPQWREWIKTEGRLYLDIELKKWFFQEKFPPDELIVKRWIQWKKDRIVDWLMSDWRRAEEEHWEEFEDKSWSSKLFQFSEKKNYKVFKERTRDEWDEWFDWVKTKDSIFLTNIVDQWVKWRDEKILLYNQWAESFTTNWINKKQWTVWVNERRDLAAKAKAASNKKN